MSSKLAIKKRFVKGGERVLNSSIDRTMVSLGIVLHVCMGFVSDDGSPGAR